MLYNQLTEIAVGQFFTEKGQENMRSVMKSNEMKGITSAVLIYRSSKRPKG